MPPQRTEQLTKRVDFVAKDADEQVAAGIVMVPNKVDLQGDFERPETIVDFAEQFENFVESDEASGGVMHAVWPDEALSLERNEVLEDGGTLGGVDVPEGAWVQAWKFEDDGLWGLVDDGILEGFSIGAVDVEWNGPFDEDELPDDVDVADGYDGEDGYWELVSGLVREVSSVDIPAVPDALIHETKAGREKRLADHLGNRDEFLEEAMDRGHSEAEAERLWTELSRLADLEGAGEPGKQSGLARLGKAVVDALTQSDDGDGSEALGGADAQTSKDDAGGDTPDGDGGQEAADDMGDNGDNEPPEWAQDLKDRIDEQSKRIDEALEAEGSGEEDAWDDAPEWAKALKEDVDKQAERIDAISKQTGATESQQLGGAEKGGSSEEGLTERQKHFIPEAKAGKIRGGR